MGCQEPTASNLQEGGCQGSICSSAPICDTGERGRKHPQWGEAVLWQEAGEQWREHAVPEGCEKEPVPPGSSSSAGTERCEAGLRLPFLPLHIQQLELWVQPAEVQPLGSALHLALGAEGLRRDCTVAAGTGLILPCRFPRAVLPAQAHKSTMEQHKH